MQLLGSVMRVNSKGHIEVSSDENLGFLAVGVEYGYPTCCRFHFYKMVLTGEADTSPAEEALGFVGTGYRVCLTCQEKTAAEIYATICTLRYHSEPFPITAPKDLDDPIKVQNLLGFIHRLRDRGVEPPPALLMRVRTVAQRHNLDSTL